MIKSFLLAITVVCNVQAYNRTPLGNAIDKTSMEFLMEAYYLQEDKNIVSSPLGVMLLLSLYGEGAGKKCGEEINALLGVRGNRELEGEYSGLSRYLSELNPDFFTLANKIYVANNYSLNEDFTNDAHQYQSEVETIDFKDTTKAVDIINKWASEKTKGHIESAVAPDAINSDAVVALFNVVFFQGNWRKPFNVNNTKDKDFYIDSKTVVKKPTMHLLEPLLYTLNKEVEAQMVELPYKESGFRMVVVRPNKVDGLPNVLEKAARKGLLEDVFKMKPFKGLVNFEMPKFELKTSLDLNELLPEVGVPKIFREPAPGIVQGGSVVVSKALQEAFIKVNEEGTTAGAVTGGVAVVISESLKPPKKIDFKLNHPFAYLILHEDKIIFAGTYTY